MDKLLKETIEQIVKEELVKMTTSESVVKTIKKGAKAGSQASDSLDKVTSSNEVGPALAAVGRAAIGAVAGAARLGWWKFFVASWGGRVIKNIGFAALGLQGSGIVEQFI